MPADDGTTYVSTLTSNSWGRDLYNLTNPAYSGDEEITSVTVYFRYAAGGSYSLVSDDPDEWGAGWSITPEFYCEVSQR